MRMSWETPLLPGFADQSTDAINASNTLQESIAQRIKSVVWYEATNPYFIKFINEFWHHNQLKCTPNDTTKELYNAKMSDWEKMFTDSFYRAAVIAVWHFKASYPNTLWIDMESIIQDAQIIIEEENKQRISAREDIGYTK